MLGSRLDAQMGEACGAIGRHVARQQDALNRQIDSERALRSQAAAEPGAGRPIDRARCSRAMRSSVAKGNARNSLILLSRAA